MAERACDKQGCNGDCAGCASAKQQPESFLEPTNELNCIKKVIGVVSGKGGVGKSLVSAMLAVELRRKGYEVGLLDADITGPSIPKLFGLNSRAKSAENAILPEITASGIRVMSINLLLAESDAPVVWRGPVISGAVKQFWSDVIWGDLDYLVIDMPPGTGDVPLTVFQSIPLDGIVVVTSPQELVSLIVKKACRMAEMMQIPVLGLVENMSAFRCPDCGHVVPLFGEGKTAQAADELGVPLLARLPLDPALTALCDAGEIERAEVAELAAVAAQVDANFA